MRITSHRQTDPGAAIGIECAIAARFASAFNRGPFEFRGKAAHGMSPRTARSKKILERNTRIAARHADPIGRTGPRPRRSTDSTDETFAHCRFAPGHQKSMKNRTPALRRIRTRIRRRAAEMRFRRHRKPRPKPGRSCVSADFVRATMVVPRDREPCGRLAIRMDRVRGGFTTPITFQPRTHPCNSNHTLHAGRSTKPAN